MGNGFGQNICMFEILKQQQKVFSKRKNNEKHGVLISLYGKHPKTQPFSVVLPLCIIYTQMCLYVHLHTSTHVYKHTHSHAHVTGQSEIIPNHTLPF